MTTAYIGLGSNEGDRLANLASAVDALSDIPDVHLDQVSDAYESEPAYVEDQPKFANAVAEVTTSLSSAQLLDYLREIENRLGRTRDAENGPRTIDLDILLFGDEELVTSELTIPHPRLLEREFVVVPLLDIAPGARMPGGALVTRAHATLGKIVGDLGAVPDLGAARNEPAATEDWVEISSYDASNDVLVAWDAAISLQREVLKDAGIPYAFDPYEPDATMDPWGMPRTFRILVPSDYAEQAKQLIDEVMKAEPVFPRSMTRPPSKGLRR